MSSIPESLTPRLPAPPATAVMRWGVLGGVASTVVMTVNTGKRAGLLPEVPPVQLIAPFGVLLAIFLVIGLFTALAPRTRVAGGVLGLSVVALGLLVGGEFVLNFVFPYLDMATIAALLGGPLAVALAGMSGLFLLAAVGTAGLLIPRQGAPRVALALYATGGTVVGLRILLPPTVLAAGLLVLTVSIGGMTYWLWRHTRRAGAA